MSDNKIIVPDEIRAKFPELIELIVASESMNDEERQYWINILPVMTPEQITNLEQILDNEKTQLAAIDEKYKKEMEKVGGDVDIEEIGRQRREKRESRKSKEGDHEVGEEEKEAEILKAISELG
ncbi:hypothetical protein HOF17_04090 [Candidatus Peribacteria bacterium]|nr:hypothetical protein [Candidatus Peribacteria bacterium]